MTLELPPLRSYEDNLEVLSQVFLEQAAAAHDKPAPRLSRGALARIWAYDFPGNVRELKNAIEHAVILASGRQIEESDLPRPMLEEAGGSDGEGPPDDDPGDGGAAGGGPRGGETLRDLREKWLAPLERRYLSELIEQHGGNVRRAAAAAGVNPVTFYRLLKRRGIVLERRARHE